MNKTIKLFLALAIGAFAVFTNGCKPKEDVKDPSFNGMNAVEWVDVVVAELIEVKNF